MNLACPTRFALAAAVAACPFALNAPAASAVEIFADSFDAATGGDGGGRRSFTNPYVVEFGYRSDAGVGTQVTTESTSSPNSLFVETQNQNSTGFRPDPNSPTTGPFVGGAAFHIDTGAVAAAGDYELAYDAIRRQSFVYNGEFAAELYAWDGVGDLSTDGTQIGSKAIGTIPTSSAPIANAADFSLATPEAGTVYLRFTATGSSLAGGETGTAYRQFLIDNVALDFEPIPEPGSMALLGLGGLAFFARRGR